MEYLLGHFNLSHLNLFICLIVLSGQTLLVTFSLQSKNGQLQTAAVYLHGLVGVCLWGGRGVCTEIDTKHVSM